MRANNIRASLIFWPNSNAIEFSVMFAKFGLILLVVMFGALLFVLGTLAPESVRWPMTRVAQDIVSPRKVDAVKATPKSPATAAAAASSTKQPAPAPIPYQQLLIPTPLPLDGMYALQLGLYPTPTDADAWVKRAQAAGVPASAISVVDENGEHWIVVAAGQYGSPEDARAARISLTRTLTLAQALPVIRLPPKPPAATPAVP
jgi:hypothetical protein